VSSEHQDGREGNNHQRDVVELPWAVGTTIEDNRDGKNERATRERDARFRQAHRRFKAQAAASRSIFPPLGTLADGGL
jgi:hypothetical protein